MDFFAQQELARRKTRWLLVAFLVSVALVVAAVDAVVAFAVGAADPDASPTRAVLTSSVVVLGIICGASLFKTLSLRAGGGSVARSLGGTRIDRSTGDIALKRLHNVVEEMSIASGVSMPEVYVLESEDGINAFAAGNSPADAAVAVTRGAITRLNREELQGVIAHEFSHVLNGDMRLNSKLLGWVFGLLVVAIAARLFMHGVGRGSRRNDKGGALVLVALAVMVIGYIGVFVGRILQASVSRHRERLADASAVQFTRNPSGLVGALLKIAGATEGSRLVSPEAEEVAHMLFAAGLPRLFATHPPIEERLKALDPGFDPKQLKALATEAARDSERQRADDAGRAPRSQPEGAAGAFAQVSERSIGASAAHGIAALAGTMASENVRYAENARLAIPEGLRDFVESADHARALVLVVLASKSPEVLAAQRRILEAAYGGQFTSRVLGMQALADSLQPELRLPAVQQLFPALRRLSLTERQQLRDVVAKLANADARIDVFECCLTLLLASSLRDELEAGPLHGSASLLQEVDAIHTLFAVLATHGTGDETRARRAYEAGISVVL